MTLIHFSQLNLRSITWIAFQALIGKIYQKSLNLSNSARKSKTVGEIVNLMAVDTERLRELTSVSKFRY